jgi:hypothetical protein
VCSSSGGTALQWYASSHHANLHVLELEYMWVRTVLMLAIHTMPSGCVRLQASTRFVGGILVATLEGPGDAVENSTPFANAVADAPRNPAVSTVLPVSSSTGPAIATSNPLFAVDESKVTLSPGVTSHPQPEQGPSHSIAVAPTTGEAALAAAASKAIGHRSSGESRVSQEAASAAAASAAAAVGTLDTASTAPPRLQQRHTPPTDEGLAGAMARAQVSPEAHGTAAAGAAGNVHAAPQATSSVQEAILVPLPSLPPDTASLAAGLEAGADAAAATAAAEVKEELAPGSATRPELPPNNSPASASSMPSEGGMPRAVAQGQRLSLHTRKRSDPPSSRLGHVTSANNLASLGSGATSSGALTSGNLSSALQAGSSAGLGQSGSLGAATPDAGGHRQLYLPSQSKGHGAASQTRQQLPPSSQLWDASLSGQQPGSPAAAGGSHLLHSASHSSLISPRDAGSAAPALGHSVSNPSLTSPTGDVPPALGSGVGSGPRARRASRYEVQVRTEGGAEAELLILHPNPVECKLRQAHVQQLLPHPCITLLLLASLQMGGDAALAAALAAMGNADVEAASTSALADAGAGAGAMQPAASAPPDVSHAGQPSAVEATLQTATFASEAGECTDAVLVRATAATPSQPLPQDQERRGQIKWQGTGAEVDASGDSSSAVPDRPSGGRSLLARLALKKLASSKERPAGKDKVNVSGYGHDSPLLAGHQSDGLCRARATAIARLPALQSGGTRALHDARPDLALTQCALLHCHSGCWGLWCG